MDKTYQYGGPHCKQTKPLLCPEHECKNPIKQYIFFPEAFPYFSLVFFADYFKKLFAQCPNVKFSRAKKGIISRVRRRKID